MTVALVVGVFSTGVDNPASPVSVYGRGGFVTRPAPRAETSQETGLSYPTHSCTQARAGYKPAPTPIIYQHLLRIPLYGLLELPRLKRDCLNQKDAENIYISASLYASLKAPPGGSAGVSRRDRCLPASAARGGRRRNRSCPNPGTWAVPASPARCRRGRRPQRANRLGQWLRRWRF